MAFLTTIDPKVLAVAFLGGIIPSFLWLWFWMKEEEKPEPKGLLTAVFVMGMIAVIVALPIEKIIETYVNSHDGQIALWASTEEILKYLAVFVILYRTRYIDEPVDWPIYLITAALGFAALENTLFLIKPFSINEATVGLLTGHLRFLGSTLLHTVSSGILGIALGLSMYGGRFKKALYFLGGFVAAIALHAVFNFFIMDNGNNFLKIFSFLWVATIVMLLLFEKVRRISEDY